jgi:hypothetical protein
MSVIKKSSMCAFAFALLLMFAGSARAEGIITVRVPFPFVIGHESFPAGHYDIATADNGGNVLSIRGTDNRSVGLMMTMRAGGVDPSGDHPALVFTKFEDTYRLSEIWEGTDEGRELPYSKIANSAPKTARADLQAASAEPYVIEASWK